MNTSPTLMTIHQIHWSRWKMKNSQPTLPNTAFHLDYFIRMVHTTFRSTAMRQRCVSQAGVKLPLVKTNKKHPAYSGRRPNTSFFDWPSEPFVVHLSMTSSAPPSLARNARWSTYVPVMATGMSSTFLAIPCPIDDGVEYVDFRVLDMAKQFPCVKFRGVDLGVCCSDEIDDFVH